MAVILLNAGDNTSTWLMTPFSQQITQDEFAFLPDSRLKTFLGRSYPGATYAIRYAAMMDAVAKNGLLITNAQKGVYSGTSIAAQPTLQIDFFAGTGDKLKVFRFRTEEMIVKLSISYSVTE